MKQGIMLDRRESSVNTWTNWGFYLGEKKRYQSHYISFQQRKLTFLRGAVKLKKKTKDWPEEVSELSLVLDRRSCRCKGPGVRRSSQGNENRSECGKYRKWERRGVSRGHRVGRAMQNYRSWPWHLFSRVKYLISFIASVFLWKTSTLHKVFFTFSAFLAHTWLIRRPSLVLRGRLNNWKTANELSRSYFLDVILLIPVVSHQGSPLWLSVITTTSTALHRWAFRLYGGILFFLPPHIF